MTKLLRRLVLFVTLLFAVNALAAAINTVPIGQGAGFSAENVPIAVCTTGTASRYSAQNTFTCAPIPATPSPSASATPTTSATPTAVPDSYFAGQGIGNQGAFNTAFSNCPYGSAYSTSSHSMPCAPTLTPTPSATPTTTATLTATPSATPTAAANTVLQGQGIGSDSLYEPVAICTTGLASRYSAQNTWTCAPIPATPTPTTSATPTVTATLTPTPSATPTVIPPAYLPPAPGTVPFNSGATLSSTTTGGIIYLPLGGGSGGAVEANLSVKCPATITFTAMYCSVSTAPGTSNSYNFKLRDNAADAGGANVFACDTGNTQNCNDVTGAHAFPCVIGDLMDVKITTTVGGAAPTATVSRCIFAVTTPF